MESNFSISFPLSEPKREAPVVSAAPFKSSFSKKLYQNAFRTNSWKTLLTQEPMGLPEEFFKLSGEPVTSTPQPYSIDALLSSSSFVKSESSPISSYDEGDRVEKMEKFPNDKVTDFKHVIYNLLVDAYNAGNPSDHLVYPCTVEMSEKVRNGFQFNDNMDPERRIPELYGHHIHQSRLEHENQQSPFIQDIYKYYLRAGVELLSKYFEKCGRFTFLYDEETPLFIPGGALRDAEQRMKKMRTRARKRERENADNTSPKRKNSKVPYFVKCGLKKSAKS